MTAQLSREETQAWTTEPGIPAGRGRLRETCHRVRLIIQEMNYASLRVVELQAPWIIDEQWEHR